MKKMVNILFSLVAITSVSYLASVLLNLDNNVDFLASLIGSSILTIGSIFYIITLVKKEIRDIFAIISSSFLIIFFSFTFLNNMGYISLPGNKTMPNFENKSVVEVMDWASKNKIELDTTYDNSDKVALNNVITQSIKTGSLIKGVKKLEVLVSSGPNYDKMIDVPYMVGENVEIVEKFIKENFLINVLVDFIFSEEEKHTVISQSKKGDMRRNDEIKFVFSLGAEGSLEKAVLIDLKDMTLLEASFWLKKYGFKYEVTYEFSESVKKDIVLSQKEKFGIETDPNTTTIHLIVSKGKKIVVPELKNMSLNDITKWAVQNKIQLKSSESYDENTESGKVSSVSHNKDDEIEEGTLITVVMSKGPIKMEKFNTIYEFRDWASKYDVLTNEEYDFNDSVAKGKIIRFSLNEGEIVKKGTTVIAYISNGKAITIPNFIGLSRSDITSKCKSLSLGCTFSYGGYGSTAKDIATAQNKKSGSKVVSGTSVAITLSRGSASSYSLLITESMISTTNANTTISSLKSIFATNYPDVNFVFIKKPSNVYHSSGYIHEDSPTKSGATIYQGQTYTIWIVEL